MNRRFPWLTQTALVGSVLIGLVLAPSISSQQMDPGEFKNAFEAMYAKNDFQGMKDLVGKQRNSAVVASALFDVEYCQQAVKSADSEEAKKTIDNFEQLALTYKVIFDDSLLYDRRQWIVTLTPEQMQRRIDASFKYNAAWEGFEAAKKAGGDEPFAAVSKQYADTYVVCLEIKDYFYAGYSAFQIVECGTYMNDPFLQAYWCRKAIVQAVTPGGLERIFTAMTQRLEALSQKEVKKPEMIDISLPVEEAKAKYEADYAASLVVTDDGGKGAGDGKRTGSNTASSGGVTLVAPKTSDPAEWVEDTSLKAVTGFDPLKKLTPFVRIPGDSKFPTLFPFLAGTVAEKGDKDKEFGALPRATYSYDGDLMFDPDGPNGKARASELKLKFNKPEPHKFEVEFEDGSKATMVHSMFTLPSSFKVFGIEFNFKGDSLQMFWYGTSAVKGTIRGHPVMLIDSDGDGTFLSTGEDTIIVNPDSPKERIEPLGRYVYLEAEGGLYPYELKVVQGNGCKIRTRPYQGDLAAMRVEWSGKGKPRYLLARGTGEDTAFFFDLAKHFDKVIWVPPGAYTIAGGYFRDGAGGNKEKFALIGKGRSGNFNVEAGSKVNTWQLGGTGEKGYWMLGTVQRSGSEPNAIEIVAGDTKVYGNFGEEYFNFFDERVMPTIEVRKNDGTGPKLKTENMKPPTGSLNVNTVFFPSDLTIKQMPKGKLVVKLKGEHSYIGKFESDWMEVVN